MNDVPVVPEVKEEPTPAESAPKVALKKSAARKKAAKKPVTKKAVKKAAEGRAAIGKDGSSEKAQSKTAAQTVSLCSCLDDVEEGKVEHGDCEGGRPLRFQGRRPNARLSSNADPFS